MGCASSTPMIATAGSEMLKAATHVADDVTTTAEGAVQDATQAVGKTVDQAKATVGTAVTGIAHELETVYVEKTEALDEAKNQLLQKLHLGGGAPTNGHNAAASDVAAVAAGVSSGGRPPSPVPGDTDSLKTSTPEPEIEQALAKFNEDKPPTPKPTLAELEHLRADNVVTSSDGKPEGERMHRRPNTTEWEQYADQLSRTRKSHPHEVYRRSVAARVRGGGAARFGLGAVPGASMTTITGDPSVVATAISTTEATVTATKVARHIGQQVVNPLAPTVPLDFLPPPPSPFNRLIAAGVSRTLLEDDSGWSDPSYNNNDNDSSSPGYANDFNRKQRWPFGRTRKSNNAYAYTVRRPFAQRYQRMGRGGGGRGHGTYIRGRGQIGPPSKRENIYGQSRREHRRNYGQGIGYEGDFEDPDYYFDDNYETYGYYGDLTSNIPIADRYLRTAGGEPRSMFPIIGRKFDYNPHRYRLDSPPATMKAAHSLGYLGRSPRPNRRLPRLGPMANGGFGGSSSPIRTPGLIQSRIRRTGSDLSSHTDGASSGELSRSMVLLPPPTQLPPEVDDVTPMSRSSRSSTNNSIKMRSGRSTPIAISIPHRSSTPANSQSAAFETSVNRTTAVNAIIKETQRILQPPKFHTLLDLSPSGTRSLSRSPSPSPFNYASNNELNRRLGPSPSPSVSPSNFIEKRRSVSSLDVRSFKHIDYDNKENNNNYIHNNNNRGKAIFVSDLSSVSGNRTPVSPYKLRDRCVVCHNKYVIK